MRWLGAHEPGSLDRPFHKKPVSAQTHTIYRILIRSVAALAAVFLFLATLSASFPGRAEQEPFRAGEAFVTRFSGTVNDTVTGNQIINLDGTVGSVIDIRAPAAAPTGQHWINEPQRHAVTAGQIGQVFGVALDDASPPNVYLTATSAFGLHRSDDGASWMEGMWGVGGGPGTVWKLNAANGYAPEIFSIIRLAGRDNSGAALGNIAFDRWSKQLYVSDMETGLIHRLSLDGQDLGFYDHGTQGRINFTDEMTAAKVALAPVAFDPALTARFDDCEAGEFSKHPECWNFADFRRRVYGLAVHRDENSGQVRLYYSVWSSQALGSPDFDKAGEEEKTNSIWSVPIDGNGQFNVSDIRREFTLPDFFAKPEDLKSLGHSHPVSDMAFPQCTAQTSLLTAERGGVRNLGLMARAPFARPHESRVLRYDIDGSGIWRLGGRYDVGYFDRERLDPPHIRANAAGGVAFGFGYSADWIADGGQSGRMIWITGDTLCAPDAPCQDPATSQRSDGTRVGGLQGLSIDAFDQAVPPQALMPYPAAGPAYAPIGPNQSYMIDVDLNIDDQAAVIISEAMRNNATLIGDVEVYDPCIPNLKIAPDAGAAEPEEAPLPPDEGPLPPDDTPLPPEPDPGPLPTEPDAGGAGAGDQPPPGDDFDLRINKVEFKSPFLPPIHIEPCKTGKACQFEFSIKITNAGPDTFVGSTGFTDLMPLGWAFTGAQGAACETKGAILMCNLGPEVVLAPGQSVTVKITLQSAPLDKAAKFVAKNCAQIDWIGGGGDTNAANDNDCTELTVNVVDDQEKNPGDWRLLGQKLTIRKDAIGPCDPGQPCKFRITVTNGTDKPYTGPLNTVDTMPKGWRFEGSSGGWQCTLQIQGPLFACQKAKVTIDPGKSISLEITVKPSDASQFPKGKTIENCARLHWQGADKDKADPKQSDCATHTIGAPAGAGSWGMDKDDKKDEPAGGGAWSGPKGTAYDLTIKKTAPQTAPRAGAGAGMFYVCEPLKPCPFTVTVTNAGIDKYEGPVSFKDTSKGGWTYHGVSSGWSCKPEAEGFTCTGKVSLEPGQSEEVYVTLNPIPGQPVGPMQGENCATIVWKDGKGDQNQGNDGPDCMPVTLAVGAPKKPGDPGGGGAPQVETPDIEVKKTAQASTCEPGGTCWFRIDITGTQPFPFRGRFKLMDIGPPWPFHESGLGDWDCSTSGEKGTICHYDITKYKNFPKDGFKSGKIFTTDISFKVPKDAEEGTYANCLTVNFAPPPDGSIKESKTVCDRVQVAFKPNLTIKKRFDQAVCMPGAPCPFSIIVENEGKGAYKGYLEVEDTFLETDAGKYYKRERVDSGDFQCKALWRPATGLFTPATQKKGEFNCKAFTTINPAEKRIIRVTGQFSAQTKGKEADNCAFLFDYPASPKALKSFEKRNLVKSFLRYKGIDMSGGENFSASDRQKLAKYKKDSGFKDSKGNSDTSGKITDDFVQSLLPKNGSDRFEESKSCASVSMGSAGLIIKKKGPPVSDYVKGNVAKGDDAFRCQVLHMCGYTITVTGNSASPYTGKIIFDDEPPKGWQLKSHQGAGWSCTGPTKVVCTHPPANLTKTSKPLELKLEFEPTFAFYQAEYGKNHSKIVNCAKIRYKNPAHYKLQPKEEYWPCYRSFITHSDENAYDFDPTGTGSCVPPNCSFYEFTATLKAARNFGPLSIKINPPKGSDFPEARIIRSTPSCPASAWLCTQTGREFGGIHTCRSDNCVMKPGESVAVRIDGKIAPDMTEPPETEQKRTACATLEWETPGKIDIEQRGNKLSKTACFTTKILARPKPKECPEGQARQPDGTCVPACGAGMFWNARYQRCIPICRPPFVLNQTMTGCVCPGGLELRGNTCVRPIICNAPFIPNASRTACVCPSGLVQRGNICTPPCRAGTQWNARYQRCVPVCRPPFVLDRTLTGCACPGNQVLRGNRCVDPLVCRAPFVPNAARTFCVCPTGLVRRGSTCAAPCQAGTIWNPQYRRCTAVCRPPFVLDQTLLSCACPSGLVRRGRTCIRPINCVRPFVPNTAGTACVCPRGLVQRGNSCVRQCRTGARWSARYNRCVPICRGGQVLRGARCVCPPGKPTWLRGQCVRLEVVPPFPGKTGKPSPKPRPMPFIPKVLELKPIQGKIICPQGMEWAAKYKRCIRRVR